MARSALEELLLKATGFVHPSADEADAAAADYERMGRAIGDNEKLQQAARMHAYADRERRKEQTINDALREHQSVKAPKGDQAPKLSKKLRARSGAGRSARSSGRAAGKGAKAAANSKVGKAARHATYGAPQTIAASGVRGAGDLFWMAATGTILIAMFYLALSKPDRAVGAISGLSNGFASFLSPTGASPPAALPTRQRIPTVPHPRPRAVARTGG